MQQILSGEAGEARPGRYSEVLEVISASEALKYAGLTLREYFEQTEQVDSLNRIQEQEESESELESRMKEIHQESRHPPAKIAKQTHRRLKSLTRLKSYHSELDKAPLNPSNYNHKLSPRKQISFHPEPKLPSLHHKTFSPQVKNFKLEIVNKFRQHHRLKTELEPMGTQDIPPRMDQSLVALQQPLRKSSQQPICLHIARKKIVQNALKLEIRSNRYAAKVPEGFLVTFCKNRSRKHSEISLSESTRKDKKG